MRTIRKRFFKRTTATAFFLVLLHVCSADAATSAEWMERVTQWEAELKAAQLEVARIKRFPEYRDQELEKKKRKKLIYWSQKTVELRDKISDAKDIISRLKEIEAYRSTLQPASEN